MRRWLRWASLATFLAVLCACGGVACGSGSGSSTVTTSATNAAAGGTADSGAVGVGTALQFFARFPVLWLGTTFDNLPLLRSQITGTVTLQYGACPTATSGSAACNAPIRIDVSQPAGASPAKAVAAANGAAVRTVRDAQAVGNSLIFNSGLTVTVTLGDGAPSLDAVFNALSLANAQAFNLEPIALGDSLAPLNASAPAQPAASAAATASP